MPGTEFNWRDQSALVPARKNKNEDKINKDTIPYLKGRISTLTVRMDKSKDDIERAELSEEIANCSKRIKELEANSKAMKAKPISDAPSIADKNHVERMTSASVMSRGQIVGNNSMFVSIL